MSRHGRQGDLGLIITTKVNVDTAHGSDTFPQIIKSVGQRLFVNCTPRKHLLQGRKRDDSAFFVGSNYNIKGSGSASVGPLAP